MHSKHPLDLGAFMSASEVAKYCEVDRMLVYQWSARGKLRPTTIGRAVLFERVEVEKFRRDARKAAKRKVKQFSSDRSVGSCA